VKITVLDRELRVLETVERFNIFVFLSLWNRRSWDGITFSWDTYYKRLRLHYSWNRKPYFVFGENK